MLYKVVRPATPDRVVRGGAEGLLPAFIEGARELVAMGAAGITTNCGFLARYQGELAEACGVPVAASSLMQVPWVQSLLPPGRRVGVVTIDAESLTPALLEAAGAPPETPVAGTDPGGEFARTILGDELEMDVARARADVVEAARGLLADRPDVGAIVLECTNMPPHSAEVAAAAGVPVYDFVSFVTWFQAGLAPRRFG